MPRTSKAAKETRRTQILDSAARCFADKGYHATTIEDIVKETGLSQGALYLYFPGKRAIYLAISERWNYSLNAAIHARLTLDLTPTATLRVFIEVGSEHIQAETDACHVLMEGWNLSRKFPALAEQMQRQEERNLACLTQLLQTGIAAGEFRADLVAETQAQLLMATLYGLMIQWYRAPRSIDWQAVTEEIIRSLCTP